jgi:3-oxoacyl-[acyl-carrier protein] reductase/cyclopentanol dehydrogenase/dihydroanticapsin dehydrogenase
MALLDEKTAVVSGALGGQGQAVCERFCAEGATVIGIDRSEERAAEFAERVAGSPGSFEFRKVDVSSAAEVAALADHVRDAHGSLQVLYNNAGIMQQIPTLDVTDDQWDEVLDVNLKSAFLMTRALVPLMQENGGSIVNISSTGGLRAFEALAPYGAAKAGLIHFTRVTAAEFGPRVRANAISPGFIDTPMARGFATNLPNPDEAWEAMAEVPVLKRFGSAAEVANLAVWLASDESSFVTGEAITIDGGSILR